MTVQRRPAISGAASLLVLVTLVGGCAGRHARLEPTPLAIELPDLWLESRASEPGERPATDWWLGFDDERLSELVEEALAANGDLRAAAARVAAAAALARQSAASQRPRVDASLGGSRRRQNFIGLPIPGVGSEGVASSTSSGRQLELSVSWEADLWGRLSASSASTQSRLDASRLNLAAARLSLSVLTSRAYFDVVESEQQLELARRALDNRARARARTRRRFDAGLTSALDTRLAVSSEASARALVASRELQLASAARRVEVLVGRYPSARLLRGTSLPDPPAQPPVGLPAQLLERRPDLRAAQERLAASGWNVESARDALYPRLSLTAAGGTASAALEDLLDGDFSVWTLAANLLQPLFQGGRLRAGVQLAEAELEAAQASFVQAALRAYAEVEVALSAEHHLATVERSLSEAVAAARAAERSSEQRYAAGVSDYLFVLTSQRQALTAESEWIEARRRRLEARLDLLLALGGGWRAELVRPTPENGGDDA